MRRPLPRPLAELLTVQRPAADLVADAAVLAGVAYAGASGWWPAGELIPYLVLLAALDVGRILAHRARPAARSRPIVPRFRGDTA